MSLLNRIVFSGLNWNLNVVIAEKGCDILAPDFLSAPEQKLFLPKDYSCADNHCHTMSDPFLYVENGTLYMLFEKQCEGEAGQINMLQTDDLINWKETTVLKESFHLSFPFIFRHQGKTYLLPETYYSDEVMLYEFERFPDKIKKVKTLLKGRFADSIIYFIDNVAYLFTMTESHEQQIYTSRDLHGEWTLHPQSPATTDLRYSRNAGALYECGEKLYRIVQDGSNYYGEKLHVMEITELNETTYSEQLVHENFISKRYPWNSLGTHHYCHLEFKNKEIVALDGLVNRRLGHRASLFLNRINTRLKRVRNT
ncbi:MAG: hypothetical protein ACHQRM_04450 [Bacteroidia bacterium]